MSLKGFEDITHELTVFEKEKLLPLLVAKLVTHTGKKNAIKNAQLRQYIVDRGHKDIHEPRIRKIAEYIRQKYLLENLIAGRKGYYIAENPEEVKEWLDTMRQRRNALTNTIVAGERSYKAMIGHKQPNQHKKNPTTATSQPNIFQTI